MTKRTTWPIVLTLIVGLLAGCTSPPPAQGPQPQQILIFDGAATRTLEPGDASYTPITKALDNLIAGIDARARTFYTAERFSEEEK